MGIIFWGSFPYITPDSPFFWGSMPAGFTAMPQDAVGSLGYKYAVCKDDTSGLGYRFNVPPPRRTASGVSANDRQRFAENLAVERDEPSQLLVVPEPRETAEADEITTKKEQLSAAIAKFEDFLGAAEQMQKLLGEKLKNRQVRIDPKKNPALREAIRRVFGIDSDTVTYDMFKQALEMRSKMVQEGREVSFGTGNKR